MHTKKKEETKLERGEVAANIQFVFFGVIAQFRPIFSLSLPARAPASPVRDSFLPLFSRAGGERGGEERNQPISALPSAVRAANKGEKGGPCRTI